MDVNPVEVVGLVFSAIVAGLFGYGFWRDRKRKNIDPFTVKRRGVWESPPRVLVHPAASVKLSQVQWAVNYWREVGYTLRGPFTHDAPGDPVGRVIYIRPVRPGEVVDPSHRAVTYVEVVQGHIIRAEVGLISLVGERDSVVRAVVGHELGHGLGLLDAKHGPMDDDPVHIDNFSDRRGLT